MSGDLLAVSQPELTSSVVRIYSTSTNGIRFVSSQNISIGSSTVDLNDSVDDQLILVYPVTDGYCVNSANSINASFIKEKALEVQRSQAIPDKKQFLYPEVKFKCNGLILKWIFGGNNNDWEPQKHNELQIWRQIGNTYTKIGYSLVNANKMINTNLYEFIPQTPLQFQEGDIFGIYQGDEFLYDQKYNGPENLRSKGKEDLNSSPQTISRGELMLNHNDFPLVTVEIMPTTSAQPNNKVLITIISLTVLLILAGVLNVTLLIAITVYCIKRKKKGKTHTRKSPNNGSLNNLRVSENLATSNPLYDNPDGVYEPIMPVPYPQIPLPPIPNDDQDVEQYRQLNGGIHAAELVPTAVSPTHAIESAYSTLDRDEPNASDERDQLNFSATIEEEHLELHEVACKHKP
ncbi:PREDICTED: uncharacterized protein LOC109592011, partial [Amphimedon queenslandica]